MCVFTKLVKHLVVYHYHCQTDINECEQNTDGCEHHCKNFDGGYNCTCGSRYALATDLHNCLGKQFERQVFICYV